MEILPTKSPNYTCGTRFTTLLHDSPPPASGIPFFMGVLVASEVTKSGSRFDGACRRKRAPAAARRPLEYCLPWQERVGHGDGPLGPEQDFTACR